MPASPPANETLPARIDRIGYGLAVVAAMAHPHLPSEVNKTSFAGNAAVHRAEVGFSAGLIQRFNGPFAIPAGAT